MSGEVGVRDIFIPYSFPRLTYVVRESGCEQELREALVALGSVVCLTGPSKSGKTVLALHVIGQDHACIVRCSRAQTSKQFWREVFRAAGMGIQREITSGVTVSTSYSVSGGGRAGLPLIAEAHGNAAHLRATGQETSESVVLDPGVNDVVQFLLDQQKTLVVDDFHYLKPLPQKIIARQIKDIAFQGLSVVILSVPHHGDDPVRAVSDMVGRVTGIALATWTPSELSLIAEKGFRELNIQLDPASRARLVSESIGSPQLMQLLCLQTCITKGVMVRQAPVGVISLGSTEMAIVLRQATRSMQFSTLFRALKRGPTPTHPRETYRFTDGSAGDVYEAVLRAVSLDPVSTSIPIEDLKARMRRCIVGARRPTVQRTKEALEWISRSASERGGTGSTLREPAVEWLPERGELVLPDAYFLFYLRWAAFPPRAA